MNLLYVVNLALKEPIAYVIAVVVLTSLEVSKIKINPWGWIFGVIGRMTNKDIYARLSTLENEFISKQVSDIRWSILDFSNSCHNGRKHTKEEWEHVLSQLREYERLCEKFDIENDVIDVETDYLRSLYADLVNKNAFL